MKWLENSDRSPTTNMALKNDDLVPNYALKSCIDEFMRKPDYVSNIKSRKGSPNHSERIFERKVIQSGIFAYKVERNDAVIFKSEDIKEVLYNISKNQLLLATDRIRLKNGQIIIKLTCDAGYVLEEPLVGVPYRSELTVLKIEDSRGLGYRVIPNNAREYMHNTKMRDYGCLVSSNISITDFDGVTYYLIVNMNLFLFDKSKDFKNALKVKKLHHRPQCWVIEAINDVYVMKYPEISSLTAHRLSDTALTKGKMIASTTRVEGQNNSMFYYVEFDAIKGWIYSPKNQDDSNVLIYKSQPEELENTPGNTIQLVAGNDSWVIITEFEGNQDIDWLNPPTKLAKKIETCQKKGRNYITQFSYSDFIGESVQWYLTAQYQDGSGACSWGSVDGHYPYAEVALGENGSYCVCSSDDGSYSGEDLDRELEKILKGANNVYKISLFSENQYIIQHDEGWDWDFFDNSLNNALKRESRASGIFAQ